jgi:diguanylate cyclase (GGDEF)-like protein
MKKKLFFLIPIIIVVVVFFGVYGYYNKQDAKNALTVTEKKWVEENKSNVIDFSVINDYPLYGLNGKGVFFNFLKDFEQDVGLEFNKVSYLKEDKISSKGYSFRILDNDTKLSKNDLLLFNDGYIALGREYQRINHIADMKNITFGVLKDDASDISYYLKSGSDLVYKSYSDVDSLFDALDSNEVGMIIIPNIMYLNKTIGKKDYIINYYFTEMKKQVVLTLASDNYKLNKIIKSYYKKWKDSEYVNEYNEAYLEYYMKENNISSKTKADLISKNYVYGYVENSPYEVEIDGKIAGIAGEYINRIERLMDISFTFKKYPSKEALEKAIKKNDVDIYFDYYGFGEENKNYLSTLSTFVEDYVVLGKQSNSQIVSSFESLKGEKLSMLDNDSLYDYFKNNSRSDITTYKDLDSLVKKTSDKLVVIDKEVYYHYQHTKFKDYVVIYTDTMMNDYKFMVKKENKAFYNLFNYIISTNSYYNYRNAGLIDIERTVVERSSFKELFFLILMLIFIPLVVLLIIYLYAKEKKKVKKVKKEDRHKYTDLLTGLKNRNYLNKKVPEWETSNVYPQAIVMIDLNNIKYINDNYGHEEGDNVIVKSASILVNSQLENTEIIRTDGNEFLVYLVGYSEKQVATYALKLEKEMKELPHEFGACVGYSMIFDEIKSLDDAINEATLEMMTKKQGLK